MGAFAVLVRLAVRNLFASRLNVFIGAFMAVGALLLVVFSAMLDSLDASMSRSVIGSVAGHIQVYSGKSKDALALYGSMGGDPDLTAIDDFSVLEKTLRTVPHVREVVPMGINGALVTSGNLVDMALERLRASVKERTEKGPSEALAARIDSQKRHVQQMVRVLQADLDKVQVMTTQDAVEPEEKADVARAASPAFWEGFEQDPLAALEFLENRIAPMVADGELQYLRYVGTNLDQFQRSFDRMEIVDGQPVPKGRRGFLMAKFTYEDNFKLRNARRLDKMAEALREGRTFAEDAELRRYVTENQTQLRELVLQFDDLKTKEAVALLQAELGSREPDLTALMKAFFAMDDANFQRRYRFFYEKLAPLLQLYSLRIGDTLTIKAFTRTGFIQSVNVPVYGTFQYKGLEKSPLAGSINLMDLMSFRDLYGYLSSAHKEEMKAMKQEAGAKMVDRESAEDALFGGGDALVVEEAPPSPPGGRRTVVADATPGLVPDPGLSAGAAELARQDLAQRVYSDEELKKGVVLNAAVLLDDETKLRETIQAIEAAGKRDGLELKAVSWLEAAGLLGGFVLVIKVVLYVFIFIIVLVAMVIVNNALMMATLRRVREIGTMRAIGARRGFVLRMVLVETLMLGLTFGLLGVLGGAGVMALIGKIGIPAGNDWLQFFFSGTRLHPTFDGGDLRFGLFTVLAVSLFAILYPAFLASRISPLRAMQAEE